MRTLTISCCLALALVGTTWLSGFSQPVAGGNNVPSGGSGDIQVLTAMLPNGTQQVVVVDTRLQSMAVYHVSATNNHKIELKSVRKIQMDLAIEQFNATEPLPSDMRLLTTR